MPRNESSLAHTESFQVDIKLYTDCEKQSRHDMIENRCGLWGSSLKAVEFDKAPFEIIDGDRGKNYPKQNEFMGSGYCLFLSAANVTKTGFSFDQCLFIDESKDAVLNKGKLKREDIVLTTRGTIGNTAYFSRTVPFNNIRINSGMVILRCDQSRISPPFLYHFLRSPSFYQQVNSLRSGAAQPQLPIRDMRRIILPLPPLPVQKRIADILSAYDELIENNQRRIKILESMARSLYREWFVHFRFPGHESVPLVPSPLGPIPKGWEVCELGHIVQFKSGFAFKSSTFTANGEHRLVTIKNVQDGAFNPESDSRINELPPNLPTYCVLEDGEILLSLTGNVGRVCLVYDGPFLLNQRVSKLAPLESFDWALIYCMFRESEMRVKLEQLSNGVAQQNLSPILASKVDFVCPTRELRQRFSVLAEPMVRHMVELYTAIQNLRRTRDLLLPRLLSGQVNL